MAILRIPLATRMTNEADHERYIRRCIEPAQQEILTDDTPVGSLIVRGDHVIAESAEAVRGRGDVAATRRFKRSVRRLPALDLRDMTR